MARASLISVLYLFAISLLLFPSFTSADAEYRLPPGRDKSKIRKGERLPQWSDRRVKAHAQAKRAAPVNGSACIEAAPANIKAPKKNVWAQLAANETISVQHWLHQQTDLHITRGYSDNGTHIAGLELQIPNKTDVLAYIDGNGAEPARYARTLLTVGQTSFDYILVGPLPVGSRTKSQPLTFPFTSGTNSIRNVYLGFNRAYKGVEKAVKAVKNITHHLWPDARFFYYYGKPPLRLL